MAEEKLVKCEMCGKMFPENQENLECGLGFLDAKRTLWFLGTENLKN